MFDDDVIGFSNKFKQHGLFSVMLMIIVVFGFILVGTFPCTGFLTCLWVQWDQFLIIRYQDHSSRAKLYHRLCYRLLSAGGFDSTSVALPIILEGPCDRFRRIFVNSLGLFFFRLLRSRFTLSLRKAPVRFVLFIRVTFVGLSFVDRRAKAGD